MPQTKSAYGYSVEKTEGGKINWTGILTENISQVGKPMDIKKPAIFFVSSMSDIFHKNMSFYMIDDLFDIMNRCPQHTFKVLTKRQDEMAAYYFWKRNGSGYRFPVWPLPNVHLGVSVENQEYADKRIPKLMECEAKVRFLSCEPLLGPVDITNAGIKDGYSVPTRFTTDGKGIEWTDPGGMFIGVNQVIVGGESGPGARPMNPDWVRDIRDQCEGSGVAFYFKQWGGKTKGNILDGVQYLESPH